MFVSVHLGTFKLLISLVASHDEQTEVTPVFPITETNESQALKCGLIYDA